MQKQVIYTPLAPEPIGAYRQAILAGDTLYVSGQIPLEASSGALVLESITAQTHQVMRNLKVILEAAQMSFSDVVKVHIFLTDMSFFDEVNQVYGSYFSSEFAPARETVQVAALPKGVSVEISCVAVR